MKRYFDRFDRKQIRVYLFEDLIANPIKILKDIFQFLGVDETFNPDVSIRHNASTIPKHDVIPLLITRLRSMPPVIKRLFSDELRSSIRSKLFDKAPPLSPELRRQLITVYREDVLRLQELIQQDLSRWLE